MSLSTHVHTARPAYEHQRVPCPRQLVHSVQNHTAYRASSSRRPPCWPQPQDQERGTWRYGCSKGVRALDVAIPQHRLCNSDRLGPGFDRQAAAIDFSHPPSCVSSASAPSASSTTVGLTSTSGRSSSLPLVCRSGPIATAPHATGMLLLLIIIMLVFFLDTFLFLGTWPWCCFKQSFKQRLLAAATRGLFLLSTRGIFLLSICCQSLGIASTYSGHQDKPSRQAFGLPNRC